MASPPQETQQLFRLGAGTFASVYTPQGVGYIALKLVADASASQVLEQEHSYLLELYALCSSRSDLLFRVPQPLGFYSRYSDWAQEACMPVIGPCRLDDRAVYAMERIWPVSFALNAAIRQLFFAEHSTNNMPFIARLYLGREARTQDAASRQHRFFSPLNYPLDAGMVQQLGLLVSQIAKEMGRTLAIIHHAAGKDGRDIEFVLGSRIGKVPAYACIDFNQMKPHGGLAENLVSSYLANDPYYPRPGSQHWQAFVDGYCSEALEAGGQGAQQLAQQFVQMLEQRAAGKSA